MAENLYRLDKWWGDTVQGCTIVVNLWNEFEVKLKYRSIIKSPWENKAKILRYWCTFRRNSLFGHLASKVHESCRISTAQLEPTRVQTWWISGYN